MQTKVEICGVNTSGLPVLSAKKTDELLKKSAAGDKQARDELIRGNLRLVLSVVQRFQGRGESPDDLFQVGCIGLMKAIDNFNTELGVRFSTYAVPMIIGEIRRYLRDNSAMRVSRSLRDTAYRALQAKEAFIREHQREPDIVELAKLMDVPKEEVVFALDAILDPVSLFEPVFHDGGVYPCDFYVLDEWRLGNIGETGLADMQNSETAKRFVRQSLAVPEECKTCQWFGLCRNGCRRDRDILPNGVIGQNIYCTAYKKFFSERFRQLAQSIECIQRMQYR